MKLLLTGGTGFFGKALLRHWMALHDNGGSVPNVWVVSRVPQRFLTQHPEFAGLDWLRMVQGDVLTPASLPSGERFTHVLHAATDSTLGPSIAPLALFDQIITGTRNLLDLAVRCGAKRFLFASSGAVYGGQPATLDRIPESWLGSPDPLVVSSAYGVAKRAAEQLCTIYHQAYGLETVTARCFAFVGPDLPLDVHFAIGNFIRDALWHGQIEVHGDGSPIRSYLDQRDLACWLGALLLRGRPGEAYNVGDDQGIAIGTLAHRVRDLLAPGKPVVLQREPAHGAQRNLYVPDVSKIRTELGVRAVIPLERSLLDTAEAAGQRRGSHGL